MVNEYALLFERGIFFGGFMKMIIGTLLTVFLLAGCSSSTTAPDSANSSAPSASATAVKEAPAAAAKAFTPAKPMKCTYDTDCMVQNPCVNDKCKLTGTECRFRSDCPKPRGVCVSKVCQFN